MFYVVTQNLSNMTPHLHQLPEMIVSGMIRTLQLLIEMGGYKNGDGTCSGKYKIE